jgi:hypothetical protein
VHKGLVEGLIMDPTWVVDVDSTTRAERAKAKEDACEAVKVALLIRGADKCQYGKLKDKLANKYLLGADHYPDTFDKAMRILGNYQTSKPSNPFMANPNNNAGRHSYTKSV